MMLTADLMLLAAIVLIGGLVKGVSGFGYAAVGTGLAAVMLPGGDAVTVMILPVMVANLVLLRDLRGNGLRQCTARFWPFLVAAGAGTVGGMALLQSAPPTGVRLGLGLIILTYATAKSGIVSSRVWGAVSPGDGVRSQGVLGGVSGLIFGATNIGVQFVAYLDSRDLRHEVFVGVLAGIMLGVSLLRVGMAWWIGLYTGSLLHTSLLISFAGLIGVMVGERGRQLLPAATISRLVLLLLAGIGLRLVAAGIT